MRLWAERPTEIANLLNPAFGSILIREAVFGYHQKAEADMPYILSFLVLPVVLHKPTRDLFPRSISTNLHTWIEKNQSVRIDFAERVRWIVPYSEEALYFAVKGDLIDISDDGQLTTKKKKIKNLSWPTTSEPSLCKKRARFVGKWFSFAGDTATILAMWGIRP